MNAGTSNMHVHIIIYILRVHSWVDNSMNL